MTAQQLIAKLQEFPQDMEVKVWYNKEQLWRKAMAGEALDEEGGPHVGIW